MRRELAGGYEVDDDPSRVDLDAVWDFLSTEAYWGRDRSREEVERQVLGSSRVVGLYLGDRQVGFARTLTDGRVAYLADVYVVKDHRGRGLGVELVRAAVDESPFPHMRWMLHTQDAHRLYEKFGFAPADERYLERPPAGERREAGEGPEG